MKVENLSEIADEVAIIGLALRVPGADSAGKFWRNLRDGMESISFFSDEELISSGIDSASLKLPNYVKAKGVIEGEDLFDAAFFGFTPLEASVTDPQQRIFLECAWEALESGGYDPETYKGAIGVYAGAAMSTYLFNLLSRRDLVESVGRYQLGIGNDKDHLPTMVSYKLNLKGPSVSVQTSCSTSLVAIHVACQSLLNGECDMALAGGVTIKVPQRSGYFYRDGGITSPDGRCRAFDAHAGGTVGGNGAGAVLLKRVGDALEDGDHIYAVIKGSAINNDGSLKIGYTAPSVQGQAAVITEALAMAGVTADSIGYVEAHGTGTALGDPIEVAALTQAYRASTERKNHCGLGSVKTNIGHLDVAAGVAGVIKTAMMLRHREMVASLHYREANPKIDFVASPFFVTTELRRWESDSPRRAGVSSFGIGGTNAHVILEEAPEMECEDETERPAQLLILSAATETALEDATSNLVRHLRDHTELKLADVAYTLQVGRRAFKHRRAVVCRSLSDAVDALETRDTEKVMTGASGSGKQPLVFMFSGQGAQYVNMGLELYGSEAQFRQQVDACAELLHKPLGIDLRDALYPKESAEEAARLINETAITQPALFVVGYALAQTLMSWGVQPSAMIGHSIGEYTAACVAGVMSLEDALRLVVARGRLMQEMPCGAMLALNLGEADAAQLLAGRTLSLAAVNGPRQTVVSGAEVEVEALEAELHQCGVVCKRLRTSHAFHSAMMESAMLPFKEELRSVRLRAPKIPYVSNLSGTWITEAEATSADYWAKHLRQTVQFSNGLAVLLGEGEGVLLEVGPGQALGNLARLQSALTKSRHYVVATLGPERAEAADAKSVLGALGRLWLAGVEVKWNEFHAGVKRCRLPLPTYPFQRRRHWIDLPVNNATASHDSRQEEASQPISRQTADTRAEVSNGEPELISQRAATAHGNDSGNGAPHTPVDAVERILTQQLEIMAQQLEMLGYDQALNEMLPEHIGNAAAQASPHRTPAVETIGAVSSPPPVSQLNRSAAAGTSAPISDAASKNCATESPEVFIPFQQTEASSAADLSRTQQRHLDQLIARYTARTRRSKELTQHYRSVHADPRAASGFRRLWKEMLYPIIAERSHGSRLWDIDGNQYVDLTMGFGVHMFGHSPDFIRDALEEQLRVGAHLGPQSALAGQVAELISELTGVERVTFCNSGTEAVMSALRVARSVTGRSLVAFFAGSYHGAFDGVLARSVMSKGARRAVAMAPGVTAGMIEDVLVLDYGSAESLEIIDARRHELAAVLVEPVQSRRPDFQPRAYLQELRRMTQAGGAALIFDEVVTGFRIHPGGCQAVFDVRADMVTYGKVIGGGMPIGVIAGKAAYLDAIDGGTWRFGDASYPAAGKTFFAGTFCKHPLAMAAARAALLHMKKEGPGLQEGLNRRAGEMAKRLNGYFEGSGIGMRVNTFGSLLTFALAREMRYGELLKYHMVEKGVYVWEGSTRYLSTAHTEEDIEYIVEAVKESVEEMREGGFIAGERRERGDAPRLSAPPPMNFLHSSTGEGSKAPGVS